MKQKALVACLAWAFPASLCFAQEAKDGVGGESIQSIIVTATKRAQGLQDVPQTITAFSEQNLKDIGAQDFSGLLNSMAGVELRAEQPGQGGVAIRGISELNMGNLYGGTGSATGIYLDELPLTAAGRFPGLSAFDMQRVEVLKGPQGTLFGEGSLAGTVRFIANKPKFNKGDFGGDIAYSTTDNGGSNHVINVMGNLPLSTDVAALRIVAYDKRPGGFVDARITDGTTVFGTVKDANTEKTNGGRLALRIAPTGDLTITGTMMMNDSNMGTRNRATEDHVGSFSVREHTGDNLNSYNITAEYSMSFADLVASASRYERDISAFLDQAGFVSVVAPAYAALNPLAVFVLGLPPLPAVTGVYGKQDMTAKSDAFELRLVSSKPGPWKWTGGVYYKKQDTTYNLDGNTSVAVPGTSWAALTGFLTGIPVSDALISTSRATIKQSALFGEISYDLTPQFQLLGGARIFEEKRNSRSQWSSAFALLTGGQPPGSATTSKTSSLVNPKFTATYKFSPQTMAYATYSQGFRSGGQNDFLALTGGPPDFDPETLINHEIGLKTSLLDNRLLLNLSGYYMKWKDLQQVVAQGIGGIGESIDNVGDAHSTGLDAEIKWLPVKSLELSFNASVLDAELDNDVVLPPSAGGITVPKGTRIPGTAKHSLSLGATYRFPAMGGLGGFVGGRVATRGDSISTLDTFTRTTPGHTVLDLKAGIESKKWQLYAFVDNATNEKIALREDPTGDILTGQRLFFWGRPRTVGLNLRVNM